MLASARLGLVLLVACPLAIAGGCGGDSAAEGTAAPTEGPIAEQQVEDFATAVNLRAGDLPGATVGPPTDEVDFGLDERFARCAGVPVPADPVARIKSATLERKTSREEESFYSAVEAQPRPAESPMQIDALRSRRGFACAQRMLTNRLDAMATDEIEIEDVAVSRLPVPVRAGVKSFGMRISYVGIAKGLEIPIYVDIFALLPGRIEVDLAATGYPHPPSTAEERRLLALLLARSRAAES